MSVLLCQMAIPRIFLGKEPPPASFAVVELFTSEGCSSCPPADKVLAELADEAKKDNRRIFPLAFHVDYWNYLGWVDSFSIPESSERQEQYGAALHVPQSYTPQMIVNGKEEFVGSDGRRAWDTVNTALASPAPASVTIQMKAGAAGPEIEYQVSGAPKGTLLCIAVVESGLVSSVRRGENAGHTLSHTSVVRTFVSLPLHTSTGTFNLETGFSSPRKDRQVIAFLQDPRTMVILGATGLHL